MRNIFIISCLAIGMLLVGCTGGQRIVNNQYQVLGFPNYTVDAEVAYIGSPKLGDNSYCSGADCKFFNDVGGRVTADMFAAAVDGKVKEVVSFERNQTNSGYYWTALKGPKVRFAGKDYVERFFTITREQDGGVYTSMLKEKGYKFDGHNMMVRLLMRNVSDSNKITIAYACSEALLPENIKNDGDAVKEFMRERFAQRITVPGEE